MRRILPWIAIVMVLAGTAYILRSQGRLWRCSCDYLLIWSGDPWSSDNSQHLLDPYSFTHLLHGFLLCGLLALVAPRLSAVWQLWLAVSIEAVVGSGRELGVCHSAIPRTDGRAWLPRRHDSELAWRHPRLR